VVATFEPGGTALGSALRSVFLDPAARIDPRAESLLLNASRAQLVAEVIRPALERGAVVICDRFFDSTLAYQGYGRGVPLDDLRALIGYATGGIVPDVTFLLDVPLRVSTERAAEREAATGRSADRLEQESPGFHERVRAGFLDLASGDRRCAVLDAASAGAAALVENAWNTLISRGFCKASATSTA
jgi:dTMP kinase